jgi:hypothetical protein
MTNNLFKKAAVCTDIHFGLKSNSTQHNEDCIEFIEWFVQKAKQEGCDTCFFLGDWNHHRASINIQTLQYSLKGLEILNNNFSNVYVIAGNHDLFYRDRRDISSVEWAKHLPNVTIIDDWFIKDNVVIAPWLVGDDAKKLSKMKGKYLFGHFELPNFFMNAQILMPDHGDISDTHVSGFEKVFSGHFHLRRTYGNIQYLGCPYEITANDYGYKRIYNF